MEKSRIIKLMIFFQKLYFGVLKSLNGGYISGKLFLKDENARRSIQKQLEFKLRSDYFKIKTDLKIGMHNVRVGILMI